jgi:hypothetical protein
MQKKKKDGKSARNVTFCDEQSVLMLKIAKQTEIKPEKQQKNCETKSKNQLNSKELLKR